MDQSTPEESHNHHRNYSTMADTYRKIYLHVVFAVKYREALLHKSWRSELFAYMSGILKRKGHYPLAVNGYHDHVHLFFDYNINELISDLVRELKKSSNAYIKEKGWCKVRFSWQNGYGVFSHSSSEKERVINYILNQEAHHNQKNFKKEYLALLQKYDIEYNEKYVFDFLEK